MCKTSLSHCRLEARIHPHAAAVEIYFGSSHTMSTSTHTGSVGKVIGTPGQIVYFWTWQEWAVVLELVCLPPEVLSAVYSYNRQNLHKDKWRWRRVEGGRVRGSSGNRDSESEAIWKVISSLNVVYLFINERKVFSEPRRRKTSLVLWNGGPFLFAGERTDTIHRLFLPRRENKVWIIVYHSRWCVM